MKTVVLISLILFFASSVHARLRKFSFPFQRKDFGFFLRQKEQFPQSSSIHSTTTYLLILII